ncbi:MAG TPA: hypothetical protein VFX45_06610 [Solirubrobacterales bacterium]|nr:hypothetical protein [Solirubrobacterales bacterium]
MQGHRVPLLLAAAIVALVAGATALAAKPNDAPVVIEAGNLKVTVDGGFVPRALPRSTPAPISLFLSGKVETTDGTHPSALKTVELESDKHVAIDVRGLPVCEPSGLQPAGSEQFVPECRDSRVGRGQAQVEINFVEQLIPVKSELVVFNGGFEDGVTTLLVHAFIPIPTPTAIVTTVKIKKIHKGRFGLHAVATVPKIAGGSGSITSFSLKINPRVFTATCPDGHLNARGTAVFSDEARVQARIGRPCRPKG